MNLMIISQPIFRTLSSCKPPTHSTSSLLFMPFKFYYSIYFFVILIVFTVLNSIITNMKTEVKAQKYELPCDFPTHKHPPNKVSKIYPCTLYFLHRFSSSGHLYAIVARSISIVTIKNPNQYAIKVSDETWTPMTVYALQSNNNWLHDLRQGQYYQFIINCRKSLESEENEFYIEKINGINNHNQISYHLLKVLQNWKENAG